MTNDLIRTSPDNAGDQRLAALREPHQPILSRVRCIALFAAAFNSDDAENAMCWKTVAKVSQYRIQVRLGRLWTMRPEKLLFV
jgi:hypothetical protein